MDASSSFAVVDRSVAAHRDAKLEYIGCLLCGGIRHASVIRARDHDGAELEFQVVRCEACGLHFTNPRPTIDSIGQYYSASYIPHSKPARAERALRTWYPHDWLKAPSTKFGRPRLLDFGCGAGHFLAAMQRHGWDVTGLDLSDQAIQEIRETLKLNALTGSLPHRSLQARSFDLITMWHSLEHVHEPLPILREAYRLLAPGGRLVVAAPNFAGWQSRWFGPAWFGLDLPRHLTHFCAATLRRMLEDAGLRVKAIRHCRHADWVRASAQRARHNGHASLASTLLRFKKAAATAAWIWSRGERGDAVLACAERTD